MTTLDTILNAARGIPWPLYAAAGGAVLLNALALLVWRRTAPRKRAEAAARWTTRALATAGISVASYGVVMFLRDAGLPWPLAILGSVLIEGSILRFGQEVYRAVRAGEDATTARRYVWLAVLASAAANVTHAPVNGLVGSLLFATFPLLGAAVMEFDAAVIRRSRAIEAGQAGRSASFTRLASASVTRLWGHLAATLGVDINARDTDVERSLRARKAATRMRQLHETPYWPGMLGWLIRRRARSRLRRARHAAAVDTDTGMHTLMLAMFRADIDLDGEAARAARSRAWRPAPDMHHPAPIEPRQEDGQQRQVSVASLATLAPLGAGDTPDDTPRDTSGTVAGQIAGGTRCVTPPARGAVARREQGEATRERVISAHTQTPEASNREISERLGVSTRTVTRHRPVNGAPVAQR